MGSAAGLMGIEVATSMMLGGLDLVTAPIAMPPGKAIASLNYEPDVSGYTRVGGYERYDGQLSPSDGSTPDITEERRGNISPVPGVGPVRGVWVYDGALYAFRDQIDGTAGMFKSTSGGWVRPVLGKKLTFNLGSISFAEAELVIGMTSGARARIDRMVRRSGNWAVAPNNTAEGYLVVSEYFGTFVFGETLTSSSGADAKFVSIEQIALKQGGQYDFTNHNFYGASSRTSMYFTNSVDSAYEWTGTVLTPIFTGVTSSTSGTSGDVTADVGLLSPPAGVLPATVLGIPSAPIDYTVGDHPIVFPIDGSNYPNIASDPVGASAGIGMSALFDAPSFIAHYKNHLFLGFSSGSLINSSLGEPLEYITTTGAGEIAFGTPLTGMLAAANTSLVIFAQNRIEYLTGDDSTTWQLKPISDASGAQPFTVQMMDEPTFLDDGGIRNLPTTPAFGDWHMGTMTQPIEPLIRQKRETPKVTPIASMKIKAKDQYRLFWNEPDPAFPDDPLRGATTGITLYIGRKTPEAMPFKIPAKVFCACAGEVQNGDGDRLFVGAWDGYVYEMNRGTSFDGGVIQSYIRLPFTSAKSPSQNTRWMKVTFELSTPDPISLGVAFDVDYGRGLGGAVVAVPVEAGAATLITSITQDNWDGAIGSWDQGIGSWDSGIFSLSWIPVEARLEYHLQGIGPNIAATLVHASATSRQHTIHSQTYNFSRRGLKR